MRPASRTSLGPPAGRPQRCSGPQVNANAACLPMFCRANTAVPLVPPGSTRDRPCRRRRCCRYSPSVSGPDRLDVGCCGGDEGSLMRAVSIDQKQMRFRLTGRESVDDLAAIRRHTRVEHWIVGRWRKRSDRPDGTIVHADPFEFPARGVLSRDEDRLVVRQPIPRRYRDSGDCSCRRAGSGAKRHDAQLRIRRVFRDPPVTQRVCRLATLPALPRSPWNRPNLRSLPAGAATSRW